MGTSRRKLGTALISLGAGCLVGMAGSWLDLELSERFQPEQVSLQGASSAGARVCSPQAAFAQAVRVGAEWSEDLEEPQIARPPAKRSRLVRARSWPLVLVGEAIDPWEDGAVALASAQMRKRSLRSSSREVSWAYRADIVDPWAGPATR